MDAIFRVRHDRFVLLVVVAPHIDVTDLETHPASGAGIVVDLYGGGHMFFRLPDRSAFIG
jgi:hypothetical protein